MRICCLKITRPLGSSKGGRDGGTEGRREGGRDGGLMKMKEGRVEKLDDKE